MRYGSHDFILKQYFRKEDGVYMQYFKNKTKDKEWRHNVAFSLKNMKIIGMLKKSRLDIRIYPGDEQTILIC